MVLSPTDYMGFESTKPFPIWPCQVWRGNDEEEEALLTTGCGSSAPAPVVAPSNVITTVFQSQDAPGRGFSASFISSKWYKIFHFGLVWSV